MMKPLVPIVTALILAAGCTVKEDRQACPCDVTVMSDGNVHMGHAGDLLVTFFVDKRPLRTLCRERVTMSDFVAGTYHRSVPKGWFEVCTVGGNPDMMEFVGDTLLCVPPGQQCDSVCAFSKECFTFESDDEHVVRGPLDKQFCTLTIRVLDSDGAPLPCTLRIRGNVDGFNIRTLSPHQGNFTYSPPEENGPLFRVRLPRQKDDSLLMDIYSPGSNGRMELLETLGLGELMRRNGYNWGTLSLDDFDLRLVYSKNEFSSVVRPWENETIEIK